MVCYWKFTLMIVFGFLYNQNNYYNYISKKDILYRNVKNITQINKIYFFQTINVLVVLVVKYILYFGKILTLAWKGTRKLRHGRCLP